MFVRSSAAAAVTGVPANTPRPHEAWRAPGATTASTGSSISVVRLIDDGAISQAVWQGQARPGPSSLHGGLPEIPAWQGSLDECLARAQQGVRAALSQLGIPGDTAFTVDADTPDGHVAVIGDFDGREALEAVINGNRDLHDVLAMSAANATLGRCVAIAQRGAQAASADPARADAINAWIVEASRQAQSQHVFLRFLGGELSARLLTPQGSIGVLDDLPQPPSR